MSIQCPSYISTRSAEVILSDVRPIKLKPEALHSVNVLLDEILYSILSVSRSLTTEKLKAALLKVLPTSLGKEALLEAEVELKAYWDRTGARAASPRTSSSDFDLQWSFELLRLKCEAYSTMNDSDEDAEAEKRLQQRMEAAGSTSPPSPALLAPAALYLTAILEAICEHVLSNVSRVAARDSSRTLATIQDLFIALGEDDAIYGMFKSMKVFEHIEALSKAQRPRRSKSFSRSTDKTMASRNSTSSPMGGESTATPSAKSRLSTDSQKSTVLGHGSSESRRTSFEKAKGAKIFHARSLSDKHEPANAALARSSIENGINREYPEFEEDEELQQEFDELMRSGATMKVSLTPDRLKSMEVYKQERIERERMTRRTAQAEKGQDGGAASSTAGPPEPKRGPVANGRRHVDSIVEDEEESGSSNHASSPPLQSNAAVRMRNTSFTAASSTPRASPSDLRLRSISISNVPHPRHEDGIARKGSAARAVGKVAGSQNASPAVMGSPHFGMPKKKTKIQKSRESMDLDEIMNGSDGEEDMQEEVIVPVPKAGPVRSSPPEPSTPRSPGGSRPHVSRAAQDLIAFLEAGPPEEPAYNPSMNASVISFESSKTRSGRLQRMMSRLTLGGSRESLNGSIAEEAPKTPRSLTRKNSKIHVASPPPPAFKSASLTSKRSIPNVASANNPYPNVVVATPPPRPALMQSSLSQGSIPASNTSSTHNSSEDVSSSQPSSLSRRGTRKAVPPLDSAVVSPSSSIASDSIAEGRGVNGHRHARVIEQSPNHQEGTSATSPISSPAARKPVILNGHPVKLDTSEASLHPRSVNITSPTSTLDRKSIHTHSKAESGYASRSASRSPITPSEPPPPPPPPPPAISATDAEDLRRMMTVASSADECRLLVDMFLIKNGVTLKDAPPLPETPTSKSPLEEVLSLATKGNDEVERGGNTNSGDGSQSSSSSPSSSATGTGNSSLRSSSESAASERNSPFVPVPTRASVLGVDRRLSVTVPRLSVDYHIVNLYRIYHNGLGLDSS